jgi:beta-lactam-binding protein with PASTA domain
MEFTISTKTPRSPKPPQPKDEPSKLVAVPDVKDAPLSDAQKALKKVGLKGKKAGEIEAKGPENVVLKQKPTAGQFVERATDVELFVSVNKNTLMPDLTERDLKEAADIIDKLELNLGKIEVNHDPERAGKIIGQFPTAKFPVTKDANAMLNVATGNSKVDLKTATFLIAFEARAAKLKLTYDGLSAALESAKITDITKLSALLKRPTKDFTSALGLQDQAMAKRVQKLVASIVKRFRTD